MIKIFFCFLLLFSSNSLLAQSQVLSPSIQNDSTLVIGIFPRRDPALTIRLFKPLKNYLEQHTRYKFVLETSPNFEIFNKKLQQRRYDIVHFNQYHYVKSHDHLKYDVLVQNEELGEKTIRGGIFVRKDSGIDSLQQLRGKKVLFGGGKKAMMSYIVPLYLLRQSGLHETDFKALFASNPPNAILATYTRQVAASGAGEVATRLPVVTGKINSRELKALALSKEMANLPWAIKRELSGDTAQQIKYLLITLKSSEAGRKILKAAKLSAFNPVSNEDYDQHREIINFVESNLYGTD